MSPNFLLVCSILGFGWLVFKALNPEKERIVSLLLSDQYANRFVTVEDVVRDLDCKVRYVQDFIAYLDRYQYLLWQERGGTPSFMVRKDCRDHLDEAFPR